MLCWRGDFWNYHGGKMAQDLVKISQDEFQKQLPKCSIASLKSIIKQIAEMSIGNISTEKLTNIVRKETKVWAELQRRGFLKTKEYNDFYRWRWKIYRKRFF